MAKSDYRLHLISFQYKGEGYCTVYGNGGNLTGIDYIEAVEAWCAEWREKLTPKDEFDASDLV